MGVWGIWVLLVCVCGSKVRCKCAYVSLSDVYGTEIAVHMCVWTCGSVWAKDLMCVDM